jgi:hypothetical protein
MPICIMEPVSYSMKKIMKLLIYIQFTQLNTVIAKYTLKEMAILKSKHNRSLRIKRTRVIERVHLYQLLKLLSLVRFLFIS